MRGSLAVQMVTQGLAQEVAPNQGLAGEGSWVVLPCLQERAGKAFGPAEPQPGHKGGMTL